MISIFAKEAFLNINPSQPLRLRTKPIRGGHVQRVSSIIRGDQIAEKIGAKFNPTSGYENDVCIYVKPMVRKDEDFVFEGKPYLDIIDGHALGQLALKHPEVAVIVCSKADQEIMSKVLPNRIVYIPQHHCNFERVKRTRTEIRTVGIIGTTGAFIFIPQEIRDGLKERNIELIEYSRFFSREDIVKFYQKIDLQLVWRPYKKILSNPLKIVNASSFGIPTIALDERAFHEVSGCYFPVHTAKEFLERLNELLRNPVLYDAYSECCLEKAETYHIDNVAKLYQELT